MVILNGVSYNDHSTESDEEDDDDDQDETGKCCTVNESGPRNN